MWTTAGPTTAIADRPSPFVRRRSLATSPTIWAFGFSLETDEFMNSNAPFSRGRCTGTTRTPRCPVTKRSPACTSFMATSSAVAAEGSMRMPRSISAPATRTHEPAMRTHVSMFVVE